MAKQTTYDEHLVNNPNCKQLGYCSGGGLLLRSDLSWTQVSRVPKYLFSGTHNWILARCNLYSITSEPCRKNAASYNAEAVVIWLFLKAKPILQFFSTPNMSRTNSRKALLDILTFPLLLLPSMNDFCLSRPLFWKGKKQEVLQHTYYICLIKTSICFSIIVSLLILLWILLFFPPFLQLDPGFKHNNFVPITCSLCTRYSLAQTGRRYSAAAMNLNFELGWCRRRR